MKIILRQTFPFGRFHATPWRVSPFDDPYGEWPPSPYRLIRAVVARFRQLERERNVPAAALDGVIRGMATSTVSFCLPEEAQRGPMSRAYQPEPGLAWDPPTKKAQEAGGAMKRAKRGLAQDNSFWVPPGVPLFWILADGDWNDASLKILDECLARTTYFGRAESITEIRREPDGLPDGLGVNCELATERRNGSVPVLCATPELTADMASAECRDLRDTAIPPGAEWRYALRPPQAAARHSAARQARRLRNVIQFAVGMSVVPPVSVITTITGRFRGRVVRCALAELAGGKPTSWRDAKPEWRNAVALLSGKDANGQALRERDHARYLMWCEAGRIARLFVFRKQPFEAWEHDAILRAAEAPVGWMCGGRAGWTVSLVPLDSAVPPPPGFGGELAARWVSTTPFVPSRHVLDRKGRIRSGASIEEQICAELTRLGLASAAVDVRAGNEHQQWVRVHQARRTAGDATNNSRRAFDVALQFAAPVQGPIVLGHSSYFGLGLFSPEMD